MKETDWRDMKVVCAAFMLVQSRAGEPITEEQNGQKVVLFHDDDYREIAFDTGFPLSNSNGCWGTRRRRSMTCATCSR